ncbi:MAG: nucleoid occlusion factor SlmA [Methylophilaceae bacterium]|nr:nucleoid occlusion factor SlmA [Methylophilaceae bacterium]
MVGERKQKILETLVHMLESTQPQKITTALLATQLGLSEAALYRHFSGKAKMFASLIEFAENSVFGLINKIISEESQGLKQVERIMVMLLTFAERNPGISRVLIGEALVNEDPALQQRVNQFYDRIEASLKQSLRIAQTQGFSVQYFDAQANTLLSYVQGRWQQFVKSGFKRKPRQFAEQQLAFLLHNNT